MWSSFFHEEWGNDLPYQSLIMKIIFPGAIFLLGTSFYTTSSWGKGISLSFTLHIFHGHIPTKSLRSWGEIRESNISNKSKCLRHKLIFFVKHMDLYSEKIWDDLNRNPWVYDFLKPPLSRFLVELFPKTIWDFQNFTFSHLFPNLLLFSICSLIFYNCLIGWNFEKFLHPYMG